LQTLCQRVNIRPSAPVADDTKECGLAGRDCCGLWLPLLGPGGRRSTVSSPIPGLQFGIFEGTRTIGTGAVRALHGTRIRVGHILRLRSGRRLDGGRIRPLLRRVRLRTDELQLRRLATGLPSRQRLPFHARSSRSAPPRDRAPTIHIPGPARTRVCKERNPTFRNTRSSWTT